MAENRRNMVGDRSTFTVYGTRSGSIGVLGETLVAACPFCSDHEQVIHDLPETDSCQVMCGTCGSAGPVTRLGELQAVRLWNKARGMDAPEPQWRECKTVSAADYDGCPF